jgi:DNA polymerase III subunit delta
MITTLTGTNSFALRAELESLLAKFIKTYGDIAVERIEGKEADYDRMRESLQSTPFLALKKMVLLRDPSANKQFVEQAEALLKELPESTDVILVEPTLDRRLSYYKLLKSITTFREFNELDEIHLERWLVETAKAEGATLSPNDARFLVERLGTNQQRLANELEKLVLYNSAISRENILLLTEATPQSTIFDLLDTAFNGDAKRSIAIYNDQREQKVETAQIIAMLTWQLRSMALIKTATGRSVEAIAKEAGVKPYTLRKSQAAAARISFEQLKHLIADLVAIDMRSKLENIDLDEALQLFLIKLAA